MGERSIGRTQIRTDFEPIQNEPFIVFGEPSFAYRCAAANAPECRTDLLQNFCSSLRPFQELGFFFFGKKSYVQMFELILKHRPFP